MEPAIICECVDDGTFCANGICSDYFPSSGDLCVGDTCEVERTAGTCPNMDCGYILLHCGCG
jgi:hypothetical protein